MKNFILLICASFQLAFAQDIIPFRSGDLWGYADTNLNVVIEPQYTSAGEFRYPVTWVKNSTKYGYIDKTGKLITKMEFDKADYHYSGTAMVTIGSENFDIDMKGNRTKGQATCGGSPYQVRYFKTYKKGGKVGLIQYPKVEEKNVYIEPDSLPAIWDEFQENYAGFAAVRRDSLWGVINDKGELVTEVKYEGMQVLWRIWTTPSLHFFKVSDKGKVGFLNARGELVSETKYAKATDFYRGIAKVWLDDDFWFYIDQKGREYFKR